MSDGMSDRTDNNAILGEVTRMVAEIIGEDFLLDEEITEDTRFSDDLALESIEFVALTEKLRQRYGDRVDFAAFVADMDIDEIMGMTVGRLVTYIADRTADRTADHAATAPSAG